MDAASLLISIRRRRGLTQAQLAARAGTSQPVVSAYEHGRRDPSVGTLRRLVEAGGERLVMDARSSEGAPMTPEGDQAHADRLLDVLSLVDAISTRRRRGPLLAPRLESR